MNKQILSKISARVLAFVLVLGIMGAFLANASSGVSKYLNEYEEKYNILYYRSSIKDASPLSSVKIGTTQELTEQWGDHIDIIEKYDDGFFNSRILVFVNWLESHSNRTHQISSICIEEDMICIELSPVDLGEGGYPVLTPWCAVLEIPKDLADKDISVTIGFGNVPNTGIPNITGSIMAMLAFLIMSAGLWGYIRKECFLR